MYKKVLKHTDKKYTDICNEKN